MPDLARIRIRGIHQQLSLDIFWLRDESLEESDNLPDPDVLAQEIVDELEAALEQFREIAVDLGGEGMKPEKTLSLVPVRLAQLLTRWAGGGLWWSWASIVTRTSFHA